MSALETLVARYGWRFTTADIRRAGIPERVVFDACMAGRARIERTFAHGGSVYLVFA